MIFDPPTDLSAAEIVAVERVFGLTSWVPEHVRQVRRLARQLFEEVRRHHGLGAAERRVLEVAAALHDVGFPRDPDRHHKISAKLIRSELTASFAERDVHLIALVARYHRRGGPKVRHRWYGRLESAERQTVTWLAGLLRVADGLDRSHREAVQSISTRDVDGRLEIRVHGSGALDEDVRGAARKRDVLERALGRPVLIRAAALERVGV